jgi:predicted nucleic-acid-binding Zn-ribbon protein
MPIEYTLLRDKPLPFDICPKCGKPFKIFMRGQVQKPKRFLWIFWRRPYCAVICHRCKNIVGYEEP